jgi:outer membrane lipoprotein-sorting protein
MRRLLFVIAISAFALGGFVSAQEKAAAMKSHMGKGEMSDAAYTAQALSAAPKAVAKDAGVVRMEADGKMKTLRESENGFTCMIVATDQCATTPTAWNFSAP